MAYLFSYTLSILLGISTIPYLDIENAFKENNAAKIVSFSEQKLILNILGQEGVYSKSQSELIIKDFFTKKPGNQFQFIFKGKETTEGTFSIGTYKSNSETFRITIQFKTVAQNYKIESLTIEKN
jgi:hypothetical protein